MNSREMKTRAHWPGWVAGWMGFHCDVPVGVVVETHRQANPQLTRVQHMYLEYDLRSGWMAAQFNYDRVRREEFC